VALAPGSVDSAKTRESSREFIAETYDARGEIHDTMHATDLKPGVLGVFRIAGVGLGFNAPAWIAATTIPLLYAVSGAATPLTILIAFLFPMFVLCLCFVALVRRYPSAGGVFTFAEQVLHPRVGSVVGWVYAVACLMVVPLTSVVASQYLQYLIPALRHVPQPLIAAIIVLIYLAITLRGVELTAATGLFLLTIESIVVLGTGLLGIIMPRDHVSLAQMYNPTASPQPWVGVFSGVLLGIFLLANFDSAINMIEEAKTPVRTVQRALVLVIFGELVLYSVAAIGWARAVPPAVLAHLPASYQGTAMTYVTNLYVHGPLRYIPAIVVITSAVANLQMAMNAGARETYRMAKQGKLPHVFAWVHSRYKTPWATALTIAVLSWIMLAALGNSESLYINSVTILWSAVYISSVLAFIVLVVRRTGKWWLTIVPWAAIGMMLYAGATAGTPALIFGGAWIAGGVLLMIYNELRGKHGKVDAVPEWTLENTRGVGE
jgi:amino acid transporter